MDKPRTSLAQMKKDGEQFQQKLLSKALKPSSISICSDPKMVQSIKSVVTARLHHRLKTAMKKCLLAKYVMVL